MKQSAIYQLSWKAGILALMQLPLLANSASSSVLNAASASPQGSPDQLSVQDAQQGSAQQGFDQQGSAQQRFAQQGSGQLVAVSLSRRSLVLGDEGIDVTALQRFLSRQSLYPFIVDGIYGSETADAVATYQRIRGLSATGNADETTLIDMGFDFDANTQIAAAPTSNIPVSATTLLSTSLARNDQGTDVIALQQRLRNFGIPLFVDGTYGFETEQAVRTYQRVQNLEVTGIADSTTLESMGFSLPNYPYIAAVVADPSALSEVQQFFPSAYVDRNRRGRFINIGSFSERLPAEARVDAAAARGFDTRVLYSRPGLLFGQ